MPIDGLTRRDALTSAAALAASAFAQPLRAAAPEPAAVTPALIEAARREGKVVLYTAVEPSDRRKDRQGVRGKISRHCVPGRTQRSGADFPADRVRSRRAAFMRSMWSAAPIPSHYLAWKRKDLLAPYVPDGRRPKHFPAEHIDRDGMYATCAAG